jgi:hypothetical protein
VAPAAAKKILCSRRTYRPIRRTLRSGKPADNNGLASPAEDLVQQLSEELTASRRHLRGILIALGLRLAAGSPVQDEYPEDDLWRAAQAVSEMEDALSDLGE